jgi:hypothetical protein
MTALPVRARNVSSDNTFVVRTRPLAQPQQTDSGDVSTSEQQQIQTALTAQFGPMQILNLDQVSPLIAEQIVRLAVLAVAAASVFILAYLWWAFNKVSHPIRYPAPPPSSPCCTTRSSFLGSSQSWGGSSADRARIHVHRGGADGHRLLGHDTIVFGQCELHSTPRQRFEDVVNHGRAER